MTENIRHFCWLKLLHDSVSSEGECRHWLLFILSFWGGSFSRLVPNFNLFGSAALVFPQGLKAPYFFFGPIFQFSQTLMTGICTVFHRCSFFPFIFCLFMYFLLLRLLGNYFEVENKVPCLGVYYSPSLLLIHRKFQDQKCLTAWGALWHNSNCQYGLYVSLYVM